MNDKANHKASSQPKGVNNSDNDLEQNSHNASGNQGNSAPNSEKMVNPSKDLTYQGGFTGDPSEIVSNPAVAPQMLDDRRDLRSDYTYNAPED